MPEQIAVGVDVGSSSARAVAIDRSGAVIGHAERRYTTEDRAPGEVDPAIWLEGAVAAVTDLGLEPAALCFGGLGPTTVALGGEEALTFRHPAGATSGPVEQQAAQAEVLRERLGADVEPRLLWDWLAGRLGGRTDAQSLWPSGAVLEGFGEVVPAGNPLGVTDGSHGLPAGMTLAAGANDAYFTSWGSGIDTPGKGFDPGGTTGGLGVAVDAAEHPDAATFGMASHVSSVFIVGGPVAAHGAALDWWSGITGRSVADLIATAAEVPPGSRGVLVLPFFEGERAPRWNLELRAEIVGVRSEHGADVIARALLESTAYGLAHIARDLAGRGIELERMVCSGGPSQSRLWNQIKADVLGVPVDVPDFHQMSSYGAALGAGAALGWWPRPGDGTSGDWPLPATTTIDPEPLDVYRQGLETFIARGDEAVARAS